MAGFSGIIKDTAKLGMNRAGKAVGTAATTVGKTAKFVGNKSGDMVKGVYTKALKNVSNVGAGLEARALNSGKQSAMGKILRTNADEALSNMANGVSKAAKATNEGTSKVVKKAGKSAEKIGEELVVKSNNGIRKNALIGGLTGSVVGAGVGGIGAMATGADEDNTKGMILMGALAGGAGGAMIGAGSKMVRNKAATGSMFSQAADVAGDMAKNGGKNAAAGGGAKSLLEKAKGGAVSFGDHIDDLGGSVAKSYKQSRGHKLAESIASGEVEKVAGGFKNVKTGAVTSFEDFAAKTTRTANTFGGAAQGALMGAVPGAVIGGISGAVDEDGSFIGGALGGALIGGSIGGVAGGIGGFAGNNAKLIASAKTVLA